jgi:hypothetical protein
MKKIKAKALILPKPHQFFGSVPGRELGRVCPAKTPSRQPQFHNRPSVWDVRF